MSYENALSDYHRFLLLKFLLFIYTFIHQFSKFFEDFCPRHVLSPDCTVIGKTHNGYFI